VGERDPTTQYRKQGGGARQGLSFTKKAGRKNIQKVEKKKKNQNPQGFFLGGRTGKWIRPTGDRDRQRKGRGWRALLITNGTAVGAIARPRGVRPREKVGGEQTRKVSGKYTLPAGHAERL